MLLCRTFKKDKFCNSSNGDQINNTTSSNFNAQRSNNQSLDQLTDHQLQLLNYKQSLTKDISHPRIRELIFGHQNIEKLLSSPASKSQIKQNFKNNILNLQLIEERKWLTKKGKKYLIDFDDNERKQMKTCFNAMDIQKNGSIGIDQLQQLLISVGLMQSRQQVKQLIDSVDQDKSGKIQFSEFLKMILNDEGQNQQIVQFFKYIINSNRKKNQQQIQWKKDKSKSKSRQSNQNNYSPTKKKVSLIHDKQNIVQLSSAEKSGFHQYRNKFYSSPEKNTQNQGLQKNSALNIFQKHPHPKNLPFGMIVSHIRRKHMMTALKIGQLPNSNSNKAESFNSSSTNKSNHYISSNALRSSQNMKESKTSSNQSKFSLNDQDITKGQSVMNALKKMWDRRLLRQIRQKKNKKDAKNKMISCFTQKSRNFNSEFPSLS